jgi:hypothetical protein
MPLPTPAHAELQKAAVGATFKSFLELTMVMLARSRITTVLKPQERTMATCRIRTSLKSGGLMLRFTESISPRPAARPFLGLDDLDRSRRSRSPLPPAPRKLGCSRQGGSSVVAKGYRMSKRLAASSTTRTEDRDCR